MSKVSDADVERAIVAYCDALKDISARLAFSDLHTHDRIAMRAALEAVSSIHEAEPVNPSLVKSYIDMWQAAHPAPISKGVTDAMVERMARAISRRYRPRFPDETDAAVIDAWVESNWQMQIEDARVFLTAAIEAHPAPISKGVTERPGKCDGQLCYYHGCQHLDGCALSHTDGEIDP